MSSSRPQTALTHEGAGVIVEGSVRSVRLVLDDARRHNDEMAWFQTEEGPKEVRTDIPWAIEEVEAA